MEQKLEGLVRQVWQNQDDLNGWFVLSDYLMQSGDKRGEALACDLKWREGALQGKDKEKVRKVVLQQRRKVLTATCLPHNEYLLQDKFWKGGFPLRFPNKRKLDELDGAFAEEFPCYDWRYPNHYYSSAVHSLRNACQEEDNCLHPQFTTAAGAQIYRPLTFRENMLARVEDYYTLNEWTRFRLFDINLYSCTGIAYKANSSKIKIIPLCKELIDIPDNFSDHFLPLDYDSLQGEGVVEVEINTFYLSLSKKGALNSPLWNAAAEEDKSLLKEYINLVSSIRELEDISFALDYPADTDNLRALSLGGPSLLSANADGMLLNDNNCFLQRTKRYTMSMLINVLSGNHADSPVNDSLLESGHHGLPFMTQNQIDDILESSHHGVMSSDRHMSSDTHESNLQDHSLAFAGHIHEDYLDYSSSPSDFRISDEVTAAARNRPNNIVYNRSGSRTNGSLTRVDRPEFLSNDLVYWNQPTHPVMRINLLNQRPVVGREGRALLAAILRRQIIV